MARKLTPGVLPVLSVAADDLASARRSVLDMAVLDPIWPAKVRAVNGSSYRSAVMATKPVAYWRLGESAGVTVKDEMGVNDGTYVGVPTLGAAGALTGDPDSAVTFNGTTQYVSVPDANSLDLGDNFSISAWIKRSAWGSVEDVIACKGVGSYSLKMNVADCVVLNRYGVANGVVSTIAISDSSWHHVVATRSPGVEHVFVGGVDVTSSSPVGTAYANSSLPLLIGAADISPAYPFRGTLDEVVIWNRALSAAEVAAIYAAGI